MSVSGGDFNFCFHCRERRRFLWNACGELTCPVCGQLEGTASLLTEEIVMEQRRRQTDLENNPTRGKHARRWRRKAHGARSSAVLLAALLLTAPAWAVETVVGNAACVALDTGAVLGEPLSQDCTLAVSPNENLSKSFVETSSTKGLDGFRAAFQFNMDQAELVPNKQTYIWQIQRGDRNAWLVRVTLQYRARIDTYRIRALGRNVGTTTKTAWINLPQKDGTYEIEVAWAVDGVVSVAVDGIRAEKAPTAAWISQTTGSMRMGAPANTKFFTGTLRFDEAYIWHATHE